MNKERDFMIQELKTIVFPYLKDKGFIGKFPHFRRIRKNRIDLITFQFDKYGGGFAIEIAKCSAKEITTYWNKKIPSNKMTAYNINAPQRPQLVSKKMGDDYWFRYDKRNLFGNIYKKLAKKVIKLIEKQAELYWNKNKWTIPVI